MTDNVEFGSWRLLASPHHKQAYQFEQQIISIINELGVWITCCWCWVLSVDLLQVKNSLLSVIGCLCIASSTCLLTAGIAKSIEVGSSEVWREGIFHLVPSALSEAQVCTDCSLRAAFLTHLQKSAMPEVPQVPQAACCPFNAILPCCNEAGSANLDRQEENQMSAFLTATFYIVGAFSPLFLQLLCKAFPTLWTASNLSTLHWGAVPRAAQGTAPAAAPADGASGVLKEVLAGCTHRDVCLFCSSAMSLVCLVTMSPKSFPQCFLPCAHMLSIPQVCSVSLFFRLNCVLICCLVTLLLSFPSPDFLCSLPSLKKLKADTVTNILHSVISNSDAEYTVYLTLLSFNQHCTSRW